VQGGHDVGYSLRTSAGCLLTLRIVVPGYAPGKIVASSCLSDPPASCVDGRLWRAALASGRRRPSPAISSSRASAASDAPSTGSDASDGSGYTGSPACQVRICDASLVEHIVLVPVAILRWLEMREKCASSHEARYVVASVASTRISHR